MVPFRPLCLRVKTVDMAMFVASAGVTEGTVLGHALDNARKG